jgi:HK97 family phage prohead protease
MGVATAIKPDFNGYATRFGIECSDGRTIMEPAFKHQDQTRVPLVWQHEHDSPENVLGHAILHQRPDGVFTEAFFNDTERGRHAKELVKHGDITALSIFANKLKQKGLQVMHGMIAEVSLVYRGANPGASIMDVNMAHSADGDDTMVGEAIIYSGEDFSLEHADTTTTDSGTETVEDVFNTLTPKQKELFYAVVTDVANGGDGGPVVQHSEESEESNEEESEEGTEESTDSEGESTDESENSEDSENSDSDESNSEDESTDESSEEGGTDESSDTTDSTDSTDLQHNQEGSNMANVFENNGGTTTKDRPVLSHDDIHGIVKQAAKCGSYREAFDDFIQHADFGIEDIDYLFPDAKATSSQPELLARQTEWVVKVLSAVKTSPMAKIKTIVADLTADEARAKGYVKGNLKKEEVVKLLKRSTSAATVYKKQKLDRDDIIDITDFDVITWLWWEIRFMLNEEIARAILLGDGRDSGAEDKVKDPEAALEGSGIRSIRLDHDLYSVKVELAANVAADVIIDEVTRARSDYRGSGSPSFYTTDRILTDLLLLKDKMGRRLYDTVESLAAALRVKEIVPVEVMEEYPTVLGIVVNLVDYTIGTNKGGELTKFEDFDIDYNQNKFLLETRLSGALTKPKSALVITRQQGTLASPSAPSFDGSTDVITIPSVTGVVYLIDGDVVTGAQPAITGPTEVTAEPATGYYFASGSTHSWTYTP